MAESEGMCCYTMTLMLRVEVLQMVRIFRVQPAAAAEDQQAT